MIPAPISEYPVTLQGEAGFCQRMRVIDGENALDMVVDVSLKILQET